MLNTCKQHAELTFVVNDLLYTFYIPTLADGLRIFFWHMLVILYILYLRPAYPADDIAVYCTRIAGMKKQPPFAFFDSATLGMFEDVKDFRGMMRLSLMTPFIGPCIVPFNCEWRRSPLSLCMRACLSIWSDCLALGASRIPNERLLPIGIRYRLLSGFVRFHLRSKLLTWCNCTHTQKSGQWVCEIIKPDKPDHTGWLHGSSAKGLSSCLQFTKPLCKEQIAPWGDWCSGYETRRWPQDLSFLERKYHEAPFESLNKSTIIWATEVYLIFAKFWHGIIGW